MSYRGRRTVTAVLATALALAGCSGSGSGTSGSASGDGKRYTVGFSNPQGAQPILQNFQAALTAAGERLGITVKSLDAQLDANKQVSDVDQFVAQRVDAIIVFPLAPDSLTPVLNRAKQAGIKILGYNAILTPGASSIDPYDANFDAGNVIAGAQKLADYVGRELGGKGNVLGVGIGFPVPSLQLMLKNYQNNLTTAYPGVKWLDTVSNPTDDIAGGQKAVADALTKHKGDVQAIMAYNNASAIGAAVAVKNASLTTPVVIVGQNGDQAGVDAVNDGRMTAMIDLVPWREALIAITMVQKLLQGQSVPPWVGTPVELYDKSTISQRIDWDKAVSDIKAGTLSCAQGGGCPPL